MTFFLDYFHKITVERFFLLLSGLFGILYLFVTPPFQVPDEPNHFYRAWQVAEGGFISVKEDNRVGGNLPLSLEKITQPFLQLIWNPKGKMKNTGIQEVFKIPLNKTETKFFDFNNTALYSPVCYFPAAFAIFILRAADAQPLYTFYMARLASLVAWIIIVWLAIKLTPLYKWLFCFLALLPMSLFINMSISADVLTNAFCFLFIAFVLRCAYDPFPLSNKRTACLMILIILLVSVKIVYSPLILLLFIIPKDKFKDTKNRVKKLSLLFFVAFLFAWIWVLQISPMYLSYENYHPGYRDKTALVNGADVQKQLDYILTHGTYIFFVFLRSFAEAFDMYFRGYIGTFGWLEMPLPWWFVNSAYLFILFIAITEGNIITHITWWQRSVIAFTFLMVLLLVLLSQHLSWDYVGVEYILNIQGRYLIPFFPLLFILFYNRFCLFKKVIAPLTVLFTIISLSYTLKLLHSKYY